MMLSGSSVALVAWGLVAGAAAAGPQRASDSPPAHAPDPGSATNASGFIDVTAEVGLGPGVIDSTVARCVFADLDGDGFPDIVIDRHRIFMNRPATGPDRERADPPSNSGAPAPRSRRCFVEVPASHTGLDVPLPATLAVFADLDDDGTLDALIVEFCDVGNPEWTDHGRRTRWQRGRGDGTFEPAVPIETPARPSISVAVGDIDLDGRLDLWFGNTYVRYGHSLIAYPNDLLLSSTGVRDGRSAAPSDPPHDPAHDPARPRSSTGWHRAALPEDAVGIDTLDDEDDAGGRPTFGTLIWHHDDGPPWLLELGYGRRWNRLWVRRADGPFIDVASALSIDGDQIRHGRHPDWLAERALTDPRFARSDEKPFRSNGNTFDAAVGDVDSDGVLDLLLTEITHAWAGESSDRTRLLFGAAPTGGQGGSVPGLILPPPFSARADWSLDRTPPAGSPDERRWNQGDLFGALADLDHDGRLDVLLSSGDYPDDERLRVFLQQAPDAPSRLIDATAALGIDHDGSQQISLADVDGDGALDILVGQTFNRFTAEQIAGRSPRPKLLLNRATGDRRSLILKLDGHGADPRADAAPDVHAPLLHARINRHGLGAQVTITLADGSSRVATLIGPGGHAGKQHEAIVHFGLGVHEHVERIEVIWPAQQASTIFTGVPAGAWILRRDGTRAPLHATP